MPTATRQATPGPSTSLLPPSSATKRPFSGDTGDLERRGAKRLKTESLSKSDKERKKRKKKRKKTSIVANAGPIRAGSKPVSATSTSTKPMPVQDVVDDSTAATVSESAKTPSPTQPSSTRSKHDSPAPFVNAPPVHEDSNTAIDKLKEDIQAKSTLISSHENVLHQIQQSVTCQICLDLLYKPYALAPCGHVACHSCLVSWFTSTAPQETPFPNHQPQDFSRRKKTCPHCRAVVKDRPVEVWTIKSVVNNLAQSGLPLPGAPPLEVQTVAQEDPWKDIFLSANAGEEKFGKRDDEDGGVYRCVDCMHEIWDGVCSNCDRIYPGHRHPDDDEDEWEEEYRFGSDHEEGYSDDELREVRHIAAFVEMARMQHAMEFMDHIGHHHTSDEEEEGYEESFIDDDGAAAEHLERHLEELTDEDEDGSLVPARRRHVVELFSDEDDDEEEDVRITVRRLGRGTRLNSGHHNVALFTEDEASESDDLGYGSDGGSRSEEYEDDGDGDARQYLHDSTWPLDYDRSSQGSGGGDEAYLLDDDEDHFHSDHSSDIHGVYSDEDEY